MSVEFNLFEIGFTVSAYLIVTVAFYRTLKLVKLHGPKEIHLNKKKPYAVIDGKEYHQ